MEVKRNQMYIIFRNYQTGALPRRLLRHKFCTNQVSILERKNCSEGQTIVRRKRKGKTVRVTKYVRCPVVDDVGCIPITITAKKFSIKHRYAGEGLLAGVGFEAKKLKSTNWRLLLNLNSVYKGVWRSPTRRGWRNWLVSSFWSRLLWFRTNLHVKMSLRRLYE